MTALATVHAPLPPALLMEESELMEVLETSLYRGAKRTSIKMVVGYCRAQRLDPLQKPVHIVPVNTKKPGTNQWEWVDTVWPGINLYRTNASRSGAHAGTSEPEFGPTITRKFHVPAKNQGEAGRDIEVSFPEWCRVVVKRVLPSGIIAEFPAREFWIENYATMGAYTDAPNAMWQKRPSGQLAKCAEAQALRKAFPESCGGPTAEEMEGRTVDEHGNPARVVVADPNAVADDLLQDWLAKVAASESDSEVMRVYQDGLKALAKDIAAATEFKRAVMARRTSLRADDVATDAKVKTGRDVDQEPADQRRGEEPQADEGATVTYAKVMDMMLKAAKQKNVDALEVAGDWIGEVQDETQRGELRAKYQQLHAELEAGK